MNKNYRLIIRVPGRLGFKTVMVIICCDTPTFSKQRGELFKKSKCWLRFIIENGFLTFIWKNFLIYFFEKLKSNPYEC